MASSSNAKLLDELQELSQSIYQTHTSTTRRTASLVLPRDAQPVRQNVPPPAAAAVAKPDNNKSRARRMSLSPWRSRPNSDTNKNTSDERSKDTEDGINEEKKGGLWNWKPIRAISHIGMQKLSCLFSVEVVTVQGLPPSMNGLRLSVSVRKKENKDGAVHTMPSRVSQGAADFEETLFFRCHVYATPHGSDKHLKFEPRPFFIYVFAVDAEELDFGKGVVDLSQLIQESIEKNTQGTRVRQWDLSFKQKGKAKGGELLLKLGFQIMEKDGDVGIYNQPENVVKSGKSKNPSSPFARKQSKSSFSVLSPRTSSRAEAWSPSQARASGDFQGIEELNLDAPDPVVPPSTSPPVQESKELEPEESRVEDFDLDEFEVVDKGVEVEKKDKAVEEEKEQEQEIEDEKHMSDEVVKEVDQVHQTRLTELDSIAQQIKALECMMGEEKLVKPDEEETGSQGLDADEETVTMEFLQMLEDYEGDEKLSNTPTLNTEETSNRVYLPDLGKGLGCVIQTKNGGYLAAVNPLDTEMGRKGPPKLAMQLSRPLLLLKSSINGFELFQRMAAIGVEQLSSEILTMMPMEDLTGKTAEQIAFEGIASAIIHGRNKSEGANSSAARTITTVKTMASAMSRGRKERISTGLWNIDEDPSTVEEILAFSMQKIEAMAIDSLKIQSEMAEEDAPFDVSPINIGKDVLASGIPLEDWVKTSNSLESVITVAVFVQLRDPLRRYEIVGGPVMALICAKREDVKTEKLKLLSLHVGGLEVRAGGKRNLWDAEKHKLTALQWLVAYGLTGKKRKKVLDNSKKQDVLWSISSRVMADMWLNPMRNPNVKISK